MNIKLSTGEKVFNVFNYTLMAGIILIMFYPLLYVLFASVSDPATLMANRGLLLGPLGFSLEA